MEIHQLSAIVLLLSGVVGALGVNIDQVHDGTSSLASPNLEGCMELMEVNLAKIGVSASLQTLSEAAQAHSELLNVIIRIGANTSGYMQSILELSDTQMSELRESCKSYTSSVERRLDGQKLCELQLDHDFIDLMESKPILANFLHLKRSCSLLKRMI